MSKEQDVLSERFQRRWKNQQIYDETILGNIDKGVQLHSELWNVRSSAAACINTIGNIAQKKDDLITFLNKFNLDVEDIIPFPKGVTLDGETYNDKGNVIFEWIGPRRSPIYEKGGKRGQNRTSIDAFILAMINNRITQLLIEWKFTETYNSKDQLQKFAGVAGNERLRRYSMCLAKLRKTKDIPFLMDKNQFGLYDLGYEPYYQLLRMTLLAKLTTPCKFENGLAIEDYRIVHLMHSKNKGLDILSRKHLSCLPGLRQNVGKTLHEVWRDIILTENEASKFHCGYWNEAIASISNGRLKKYLLERYE